MTSLLPCDAVTLQVKKTSCTLWARDSALQPRGLSGSSVFSFAADSESPYPALPRGMHLAKHILLHQCTQVCTVCMYVCMYA